MVESFSFEGTLLIFGSIGSLFDVSFSGMLKVAIEVLGVGGD